MNMFRPPVQANGFQAEAKALVANTRNDFLGKVSSVGEPAGRRVSHFKEKRIILAKALELTGDDPSKAAKYSARQVRKLYPEARDLVYEKAAENGCRIAGLREGVKDRVIVIGDREKEALARAFLDAAARIVGPENVKYVDIDSGDYGERPFSGNNATLEKEIREFKPTTSFYAASAKKGEVEFRIPLIDLLTGDLNCAHAHSPGLTDKMMAQGLLTNHADIVRVTEAVAAIMRNAKSLKVTTSAGTDLTVDFAEDGSMNWILDHTIQKGTICNLPCGEAYTCPVNANGVMIVDGILGDYFDQKYGLLQSTPVEIRIENGRFAGASCKNKLIEKDLKAYVESGENSDRVGELGIGTNVGLTEFIGALLQDEKIPGIHVAFGNPAPHETNADWTSETHLDCTMRDCNIEVTLKNGRKVTLMTEGRFAEDLESIALKVSLAQNPSD